MVLGQNGVAQKPDNDRLTLSNPFVVDKDKGEIINLHMNVWQPNARQVTFQYDLSADRDVPLTQLIASVYFEPRAGKGKLKMFKPKPASGNSRMCRSAILRAPRRAKRSK